jgi:putative aldouronate transport system permease protein
MDKKCIGEQSYRFELAKNAKNRKNREGKKLFLLILPFLILSFVFSYFPLHGWIYALYDYRAPLKLSQCEFVGLKWFKALFNNPTQVKLLVQVMKNTFAMSLLGIATSFLPVLFAVFLNEIKCKWFKNLVQTLTTLPNFISWTLVYSVAFCLFSPSGMLNTVLQQIGAISEPLKILDSSKHVWLQMILWSTWKGLGWGSIMYLAAIAGIDQELYDAAKVDGAGRWQLMRKITIPSLMPTYFVMLMLSVANFLNNGMDQYYVFQNSFNKQSIQVLDLYVYNIGMTGRSLSLATAIGIMKSLVSVTLLVIVNYTSKKTRGESII